MRIYTYKNSTQLRDTVYWETIKEVPHFCASEVLAIGIKKFYGRENFTCLTTIDTLLNKIFPMWRASQNDIVRYRDIAKYIKEMQDEGIDKNITESFSKNKRNLLDSTKFLFETEELIVDDEINEAVLKKLGDRNEKIQMIFKDKIIKKILENGEEQWLPDWENELWNEYHIFDAIHECRVEEVLKIMKSISKEVFGKKPSEYLLQEFEELFTKTIVSYNPSEEFLRTVGKTKEEVFGKLGYSERELKKIHDCLTSNGNNLEGKKLKEIVFHGIYRLKPIHLRLFKELEKMNFEVILLNCYNEDFPEVYSCWNELYKMVKEVFTITDIKIDRQDNVNHREIGTLVGNLIEGKPWDVFDGLISKNDLLNIDIMNSNHIDRIWDGEEKVKITELINMKKNPEISVTIEKILEELNESSELFTKFQSTMQFVDYVSEVFDNTQDEERKRHIGKMKEQFYGVKGTEMNQIFQVFYPDEFGVKPFFSYPIGQFILSLYSMWNIEKNKLILDDSNLKECLNLEVWNGIEVNAMYSKLKMHIGLAKEIKGLDVKNFNERLDSIVCIKKSSKPGFQRIKNELEGLSFFDIGIEELETFKRIINNINDIANTIFKESKTTTKKHYMEMIKVLSEEKEWKELSGEEKNLIKEIDSRLNNLIDDEELEDFETIKDTLKFYLANQAGEDINWLVRDLDQIEGDILSEFANAKKQKLYPKIYHFAMLSNENMLDATSDNLPWPLKYEFFADDSLVKILRSIDENSIKYRRCLVFQGLYYLINEPNIRLKISYIEKEAEEKSTPYFVLTPFTVPLEYEDKLRQTDILKQSNAREDIINLRYLDRGNPKKTMGICPFKFMYSFGIGARPEQFKNSIQVKMYISRIVQIMMKKLMEYSMVPGKTLTEKKIDEIIQGHIENIAGRYLTKSEIAILIERQKKYWGSEVDLGLKQCWRNKIKRHEYYKENNIDIKKIEQRLENLESVKSYMEDYLNNKNNGFYFNGKIDYKISEEICKYCSFKEICLYSYRDNATHILRGKE